MGEGSQRDDPEALPRYKDPERIILGWASGPVWTGA